MDDKTVRKLTDAVEKKNETKVREIITDLQKEGHVCMGVVYNKVAGQLAIYRQYGDTEINNKLLWLQTVLKQYCCHRN